MEDKAAFDALYARYEKRLFGFILTFVGNRQDAEEIFHDVFLALLDRPADASGDLESWLFTVARNRALNRVRSRRPVAATPSVILSAAKDLGEVLRSAQDDELR